MDGQIYLRFNAICAAVCRATVGREMFVGTEKK